MTIDYRFYADWNSVLIRVVGSPSSAELEALVEALEGDARVRPQHLRFSDLRNLSVEPDADAVRTFAKSISRLQKTKPFQRNAILAGGDVYFGMARVFVSHVEDATADAYGVFRDLREALSWLGLPPDMPDPFSEDSWVPDWVSVNE